MAICANLCFILNTNSRKFPQIIKNDINGLMTDLELWTLNFSIKKSRPEPASGILAVPSLLKTFSLCLSYQSATIGAQRTEDGGGNGHQQLENFHHGVSCDFHGIHSFSSLASPHWWAFWFMGMPALKAPAGRCPRCRARSRRHSSAARAPMRPATASWCACRCRYRRWSRAGR